MGELYSMSNHTVKPRAELVPRPLFQDSSRARIEYCIDLAGGLSVDGPDMRVRPRGNERRSCPDCGRRGRVLDGYD